MFKNPHSHPNGFHCGHQCSWSLNFCVTQLVNMPLSLIYNFISLVILLVNVKQLKRQN